MGELAEDELDRATTYEEIPKSKRRKKKECFICGDVNCGGHGFDN